MYFSKKLSAITHIEHGFCNITKNGLPANEFHPQQEHSSKVIEARASDDSGTITADAVFTKSSRPISIITADCLPILVSSTAEPFVAAIHAGWRGLSAGIIKNSFNAFSLAGIDKSNLRVALGPCIRECCYEVQLQMIRDIEAVHGVLWTGEQTPWSSSRPTHNANSALVTHGEAWLSLSKYCHLLLTAEGINPSQIDESAICTYCSNLGFGSYRRRQHKSEPKTFQYSWIRSLS
ncbi:polyphenol oxidase family protein [Pseudomonas sp. FEN]|uniref:polyphenol oxidase family protein n=1 Tax=Pseudomonas sp. FEN TaxID=2767468 RepID=UPI00174893E5|nr:polyphenol oxidase family protein [Pseudomonas sp. FEN]